MSAELAAAYVGLSVSAIGRLTGLEFPKPVWITAGRKIWLREDLDRWLDARAGRAAATDDAHLFA